MDLIELKTLQDWVVERKLRIVPGVADVSVLGGKTKEFQAEIDLNKMMAYGLTLPQIITAISTGNSNVGGRTIAIGEQSVNVRGIGVVALARGHRQHRPDAAGRRAGAAVRRRQGADRLHAAARHRRTRRHDRHRLRHRADAEARTHHGGGDARARRDRHASTPTAACRPASRSSRSTTAAIWSRSRCSTVLHNMLFGIALIFLIQWMFLGDLRCALIVAATIPVALLLAVMITVLRGESANLLSVGAIDLGIIVDAHRHHGGEHLPPSRAPPRRARRRRPTQRSATSCTASSPPRSRSTRRSSSRSSSPSRRSCRCSPCRASRARSSARCRAPTPMRCSAR